MARRSGFSLIVGAAVGLLGPAAVAQAASGPQLTLTPERVGGDRSVLVGTYWRVRVVMAPAVAGQTVNVRIWRDGRPLAVVDVALTPSRTGRSVAAVVPVSSRLPGTVEIRATHVATPEVGELQARRVRVSVLPLRARLGTRGPAARQLQLGLAARGYVVGRRGVFDARTARAVLAFRKLTGMARTSEASSAVFRALARGAGHFKVRYPSHAKHIEADLSAQVMALIRGGRVERIYPISSGKPSTPSPIGSFRVYSKTPGINAKGMVFSSYFLRGYAVHGYAEVPVFAASHGCLRVPVPDAVSIYTWLAMGDRVDVYP